MASATAMEAPSSTLETPACPAMKTPAGRAIETAAHPVMEAADEAGAQRPGIGKPRYRGAIANYQRAVKASKLADGHPVERLRIQTTAYRTRRPAQVIDVL